LLTEISAVVRGKPRGIAESSSKAGLKYIKEIYDVKDAPPSLLFSLTHGEWLKQSL
jgi:hypothetical protein